MTVPSASPRSSAAPSHLQMRARPATAVAAPAPAVRAGEGTRHERVRMDLLVARARAARS
jgi:hypothetical protein